MIKSEHKLEIHNIDNYLSNCNSLLDGIRDLLEIESDNISLNKSINKFLDSIKKNISEIKNRFEKIVKEE